MTRRVAPDPEHTSIMKLLRRHAVGAGNNFMIDRAVGGSAW
ncbi:hypothetical protein ACFQZ8_14420 [Micromonospora azadirachtae]|uniref:Uncharacterized protein n=1 Tax=Micromonospora azadirachtae TaxID=1970735 RepID=A0ABW3A2K7_9ACTN